MTRKIEQRIPKIGSHGAPFRDGKAYHRPPELSFWNSPAPRKDGKAWEYITVFLTENPDDALHDSSHALSSVIHLETGTDEAGSYFKLLQEATHRLSQSNAKSKRFHF